MLTPEEINALLITSDFRGDHSADVSIAIKVMPNETVCEFVSRMLSKKNHDHIELRIIR